MDFTLEFPTFLIFGTFFKTAQTKHPISQSFSHHSPPKKSGHPPISSALGTIFQVHPIVLGLGSGDVTPFPGSNEALTLKGTMIRLPSGTGWSDPGEKTTLSQEDRCFLVKSLAISVLV